MFNLELRYLHDAGDHNHPFFSRVWTGPRGRMVPSCRLQLHPFSLPDAGHVEAQSVWASTKDGWWMIYPARPKSNIGECHLWHIMFVATSVWNKQIVWTRSTNHSSALLSPIFICAFKDRFTRQQEWQLKFVKDHHQDKAKYKVGPPAIASWVHLGRSHFSSTNSYSRCNGAHIVVMSW